MGNLWHCWLFSCSEKYLQNLLQIEVMLKMWFPQVAARSAEEPSQTTIPRVPPQWQHNQLHMPVKVSTRKDLLYANAAKEQLCCKGSREVMSCCHLGIWSPLRPLSWLLFLVSRLLSRRESWAGQAMSTLRNCQPSVSNTNTEKLGAVRPMLLLYLDHQRTWKQENRLHQLRAAAQMDLRLQTAPTAGTDHHI